MRIVVNDIAASYGGAMSILRQFYAYVRDHDEQHEWFFILSDRYLEETDRIHVLVRPDVKRSGLHKLWFDFCSGRRYIRALHPDVVLSLQNILTFGVKAPQYVYIHQSIPFQKEKRFSFFKREESVAAVYQYVIGSLIKRSAKSAKGVIVQTQWMKDAVIETTYKSAQAICVAKPDVDSFVLDPAITLNTHRFFFPTNGAAYKNDAVIIRACRELRKRGITDFEVCLTLPDTAVVDDNIRCVGRLDREQMGRFYQSSVLLFPSYIETVGLPLLEAKQCQTVILAADCAYAHETVGDYEHAFYFNYNDEIQLADLMQTVMQRTFSPSGPDDTTSESDWQKVLMFIWQR